MSNHGAVWSPDGKWIAFVQSDESEVKLRSELVPDGPSYPKVREVRFARVGGTTATLRVGGVDDQGKETCWLPIPMPAEGFYLGEIGWAGNSQELLIEKLNRFRNEREFLLADTRTGGLRRVFHETNPAWVDASQHSNAGWTWIRDGQAFIVLSEKDGRRHAYVYSRDGKELALLTPGEFDIIERAVVDETGGWFYFYASPDNATQKYLYRVGLDGAGTPERVTPENQPGTHDCDFSPDAKWAFHTYSTFDEPPTTELVQLSDHKVVRALEDNEGLRKRMKPLISQPTEFFQLAIGGGVVLDAWMIKPPGFDPSKEYPVLVYVYGEPLEGVDREALYQAVRAGLKNQDGRARGSIGSVYRNLSAEEIKPLLPAIYQAIIEPAPSGEMFADSIRVEGLRLLAKHRIEEGIRACVNYTRDQNPWASEHRTPELMKILLSYGTHAKSVIPELTKIAHYFEKEEKDFPKELMLRKAKRVRETMVAIEAATDTPELINLK